MMGHPEPVHAEIFEELKSERRIVCTNQSLGFDGFPHVRKTCQVFWRRKGDSEIHANVAREHDDLIIDA